MIEIIENETDLSSWDVDDIYSVRIFSLLKSYGTKYNFAKFYRQVIDGKITAVISSLDNNLTLALNDGFDNEEIVRFLCVNGYSTLLCDEKLALSSRFDEGDVMVCSSKFDASFTDAVVDEYPKLMDLYNFIDYEGQDFKAWYVDISHRVRHKTAKAYTLKLNETIIASGILSSIYNDNAVLTAVQTMPEYRNMGYGSALVSYICSDVSKNVYIMREQGRNENFYSRLGFKNIGKWRMYK